MVRQDADEAPVVSCDRPIRYQHPGNEEAEQDREPRDCCVGKGDENEERTRRMDTAGEPRQSGGRCIPAVENGRGRAVVAGGDGVISTAQVQLVAYRRARGHSERASQ